MDVTPVIEVSDAELDEVFGGQASAICVQTADAPCPGCADH